MWEKNGDAPIKRINGGDNRGDKKNSDPRRFLDNHPARQGAIPKRADGLLPEKPATSGGPSGWQVALSQQILGYHDPEPVAAVGDDWMSKLKQDSISFLDQQRGGSLQEMAKESIYKKGLEILIDKIFALLQRYMYEFNKVAAGTDLHVSGTISGDVTEVTRFNKLREAEETQTFFRARFSTRLYSLILRGKDDSVDFYLLPVNRSMGLSRGESDYKPLATIQVKITEEGMMWRMRDGQPATDSLESLSIWLFQQLVEQTREASGDAMRTS